ncbi:BlaI/MecI/CopY family transcriptional regulator [Marinigracilibium pacificum]|uniref:BlaI/MecI/CopY family transcriptional regulator n=1 Tax=Marinigracilibium pacificum TaxID=2729599 RepID=A0A848J545_9BACT|nr:BlaI/MecI/CopY family transcriptional regulator [Marinigracilibium pacificum]NMM49584.1 BlaI/MecI/CopY family transcriptional regulator [Marinigracilibium pacificum]
MSVSKPTESELDVLRVLWERGPSTVREVHDELSKEKDTGYTTTLKIMQLMYEKEYLSREKHGKTHIYTAEIDRKQTSDRLIDRLLETTFQGSASKLVMHLLGNKHTNKSELEKIKKYLDELEDSQN